MYFDKQEFIVLQKYFAYYASIMLNASGIYFAHNYASIIGGSLATLKTANILKTVNVKKPVNVNLMAVAITG